MMIYFLEFVCIIYIGEIYKYFFPIAVSKEEANVNEQRLIIMERSWVNKRESC